MTTYTAAHWGVYEVDPSAAEGPTIRPVAGDPDPSSIGLHQLDPGLNRTRVRRPAVRKSWLEHGPGARTDLRGRTHRLTSRQATLKAPSPLAQVAE
ncbi:hypothetical protein, partial [Rhodobium orientis]